MHRFNANLFHSVSGVLRKFKKTLSNFKGKPPQNPHSSHQTAAAVQQGTVINNCPMEHENKTHRFGPLIWRTSKERHKAKHQRRDKCNSGDSGIHVELENDECLVTNTDPMHSDESVESRVIVQQVKRANSAKASTTKVAVGGKALSKTKSESMERAASNARNIKNRSFSQPTDLNRIMPPPEHDVEGSDTDSVSSQPEGRGMVDLVSSVCV